MSEVSSARAHPVEGWMTCFGPELKAHLGRMLATGEDAEDVLQQVWITAYRKPPDDGPGSNVRAWLYRVATNAALDALAKDRRRRRHMERMGPELAMAETEGSRSARRWATRASISSARMPASSAALFCFRAIVTASFSEIRSSACCAEAAAGTKSIRARSLRITPPPRRASVFRSLRR